MVARLKLKGIDGGSHKRWSMWLNSSYAKNLILGLTCAKAVGSSPRKRGANGIQSGTYYRCCMAVVSSCREMSG